MRYIVIGAALLMAACGRLPRELRSEIEAENDRLRDAQKQVERSKDAVKAVSAAPATWRDRLRADEDKLRSAERLRQDLEREDSEDRAKRLVADSKRLRSGAVDDARAVESDARHWLDVQRNMPSYLAKLEKSADFSTVATVVEKAGQDWPAKKSDLESRLASMKQSREVAQARLKSNPNDVAAVIEMEKADPAVLQAMSGQLYDSWDKILEDLDQNHDTYREKLKIVKAHYVDVAEKKIETSTEEKWVEVPEASWRAVEDDLGMAIAHKDAGLYDSEAKNLAQPPGYAYIAPPSQGSNQYGYWTHNSAGSLWTFLPQYLIMRELFRDRGGYRQVGADDYNRYSTAQRAGRKYYGIEGPGTNVPKYGTHGTFTREKYGSSRYVQSGGFGSSTYTARRDSIAPQAKKFRSSGSDPSVGRRFGGSSSSGRRFGSSSSGRRFGGRRR